MHKCMSLKYEPSSELLQIAHQVLTSDLLHFKYVGCNINPLHLATHIIQALIFPQPRKQALRLPNPRSSAGGAWGGGGHPNGSKGISNGSKGGDSKGIGSKGGVVNPPSYTIHPKLTP